MSTISERPISDFFEPGFGIDFNLLHPKKCAMYQACLFQISQSQHTDHNREFEDSSELMTLFLILQKLHMLKRAMSYDPH